MISDLIEGPVLVTGASGFIGGALAKFLIGENVDVTCIVRSHGYNQEDFPVVYEGDVTDFDFVRNVISSREIKYIFHLAANSIVRISARDPMSTYQSNVMGTVSVLEAARQVGGLKKIIVASSDKAYGDHIQLPYTEDMALVPKNTYDTSKACADMIARSYASNYGLPVVVTRCSNVYGPGDMNYSRIIPNSIRRILKGLRPMLYSDVSHMSREFVYIDDVVEAYLRLALSRDQTNGLAFNIGGTEFVKIEDLVNMICSIMGRDNGVEIAQRDPVFKEIKNQYIDSTLLRQHTLWRPEMSLQEGLEKTVDWYHEEGLT